ncbi:MAG: hypothetical protein F6J86_25570 [Symploca sp. SIO1B1]|nr:hypothetical protein [Symploca sp. SIO1C2]NER97172.1 hypothetical protein [Symploca sp. SIO1B1]
MKEQLIRWFNQLLVVNVFFVLLSFVWFAIALLGRSVGVPLGFDLWYSLWEPVFTPAIGILMAGALISGLINYVSKRLKAMSASESPNFLKKSGL